MILLKLVGCFIFSFSSGNKSKKVWNVSEIGEIRNDARSYWRSYKTVYFSDISQFKMSEIFSCTIQSDTIYTDG
jgi:hypothetical protein